MADTFSQWSMNKWEQIKSKLFVAVFAVLTFVGCLTITILWYMLMRVGLKIQGGLYSH